MAGAQFSANGYTVRLQGYTELVRALRRTDDMVYPYLRRELLDIAGDVRSVARTYVKHRTGRHGGPNVPRLAPSIRSGVTTQGASVFSSAPHSIVQDVGGRVGHGAILKRSEVSHYMTDAVRDSQPYVTRRLEVLLSEIEHTFEV